MPPCEEISDISTPNELIASCHTSPSLLLKIKSELCIYPNYPKDSLGLFLDILNLFSLNNIIAMP